MKNRDLPRSYHEFFTSRCEADYLFGLSWHGTPTIPTQITTQTTVFLAVFADRTDLISLREDVSKFLKNTSCNLELFLLPQKSAARHLLLSPELAQRIYDYGWFSDDSWLETMRAAGLKRDKSVWMAQTLLDCSGEINNGNSSFPNLNSVLSKDIQSHKEAEEALSCLLDQYGYANGQSMGDGSPPPIQFVEPIALYRRLNDLILITNRPIETMSQFDLDRHQSYLDEHMIQRVQICTAEQFDIIIHSTGMLDVKLRRYQRLWGADLVQNINFDQQLLFLNAAASVSEAEFLDIGQTLYLNPPDSTADRDLIHDLQNRLLNIRLQNEILSGLRLINKGDPPLDLPDKTLPVNERLQIIKQLFSWWANFYFSQVRLR